MKEVATKAAPVKSVKGSLFAMFERLAGCESGKIWNINTGNSFYGGLQFTLSSWKLAGGNKYAPSAHKATKLQQISTAVVLLAKQGWRAWPVCSRKLGFRK